VTHLGQHTANFAIAAFVQHHEHIGAVAPLTLYLDRLHLTKAVGQVNAALEFRQLRLVRLSSHTDQVGLLHAISRMGQPIGEFTVVRDDDEPFAIAIQSPNGKHPLLGRHEVNDAHSTARIEVRRNNTHRLVDDEVHPLWLADRHAVDADLVLQRVDLGAKFRHHLTVDFHASFLNEFLAITPAADSGCRKDFLQSLRAICLTPLLVVARIVGLRAIAAGRFGARHDSTFFKYEPRQRARGPIAPS